MNEYELTILEPEDMMVREKIELEDTIKKYARIHRRRVEGVKALSYPIKGHERALYLYYVISMAGDNQHGLCGELNIDDKIVRYLLVRA